MSGEITIMEAARPLTVQEIKTRIQVIQKVLKEVMKKDVHYGQIPGTGKNTLYKPGAEVVLATFHIAATPIVEDLSTLDEIRYRVAVQGLALDGTLIGTGIGECSTSEEKYRWRGAVCDAEFDDTQEDRRRLKYGRSKGGGHYTVKQIRTCPADLANTVLKMAKKRAMIDMTLTATACSDIFDQDLEDLPDEVRENLVSDRKRSERGNSKPQVASPQTTGEDDGGSSGECLTPGQQKMLAGKCEEAGVTSGDLINHLMNSGMAVNMLADIEQSKLTSIVKMLRDGEVKPC